FVSATFSQAGPYCKTSEGINMNTFASNQGGKWEGEGITSGTSMFYPGNTNSENVTITHYTQSEPKGQCKDVATMTIAVRPVKPAVAHVETSISECVPVEAVFNSPNSNLPGAVGTWNFGDGSEPVNGLSNISHVYTTAGTYVATFNYVDDIGCRSLPVETRPVVAHELPKPDFSVPDEIFISDPQVQITNLTALLTSNTYKWKLSGVNEVEPISDVNPVMEFPKIGKYNITLQATSAFGCKNDLTKTVEVKNNFNIFIPNSFSPNFDGLNDVFGPVFTPYGLDVKSFEMEIFDRWGHSIYRTKDVGKGWDGSIQNKGEPLKEEVYIYRIKYKDMDGNAYNKMGHVSLVK
ncbi:MAG: gliding motility-associated C-terminal domain-containing protein, partial [Bacteroidia bacterium]|nr:gliding motility-associated C-terminal domain-containing protein [Bacteroidia bacterium]